MAVRPLGREGFAAACCDVSRETLDRLTLYLELLARWQPAINLVGSATLADPWRRHVLELGAARRPPAARSRLVGRPRQRRRFPGHGPGDPWRPCRRADRERPPQGPVPARGRARDRRGRRDPRRARRAGGAMAGWRGDGAGAGSPAPPVAARRAFSRGGRHMPFSQGWIGRRRIDRCRENLAYGARNVPQPVGPDRRRPEAPGGRSCA